MTRTTIMVVSLLAGCVTEGSDGDELTYGEDEQAIEDGTFANAFQIARAARMGSGCSATQIAPDTVLTALHCTPVVGEQVAFWTSATAVSATTRTVSQVILPPGTFIVPGIGYDWTDNHGDHADIAVLRLSLPMRRTTATLAWNYPGSDKIGQKVGNGNHEEVIPGGTVLLQRSDYTHGDDDDGEFLTNQNGGNKGNSGGPYYVNAKQVGVLTGATWDTVWRGWHTSVPHHLDFILDAMDYDWPFGPENPGIARSGPIIELLLNRSHQVCRYACDKTTTCKAFTFIDLGSFTQCSLLSSVTTSSANANASSAAKP
jgi:hypothetical protein